MYILKIFHVFLIEYLLAIYFPFNFKFICSKEILISEIPSMKQKCLETMCSLEKVFPLGMFDIQVHLVCHLVDELEVARIVHARWMYWVERFMKVCMWYMAFNYFFRIPFCIKKFQISNSSLIILIFISLMCTGFKELC